MKNNSEVTKSFTTEKAIEIHIAEFNALRDEIIALEGFQANLMLYFLVTLAASIPVITGLLQNELWITLLFVPLIFSTMGWVYSGYLGMMYRLAIYIEGPLKKEIHKLFRRCHSYR